MSRPALAYALMFLAAAVAAGLFGFGAVGNQAGDGGKLLAGICLALAALSLTTGWVLRRRANGRRLAAWSR